MPMYEFVCKKCGVKYDKIGSDANTSEMKKCPECLAEDAGQRVWHKIPVTFKGGGWAGKNHLA